MWGGGGESREGREEGKLIGITGERALETMCFV